MEASNFSGDMSALTGLAVALGCGLLMGIERERRKGAKAQTVMAGMRSFALSSLTGACTAFLGSQTLMAVGAAFVALISVVAYAYDRSDSPGITTEIALFMAYLIGVLAVQAPMLASGLTVMVTGLLAARDSLHQFARDWLRPGEAQGGLILGALALLVMPLVPDRALWGPVLNPQLVMKLLIVLLLIQSLAHVGRRLLQARQAVALSALASGFVSSTATIGSLGMELRTTQGSYKLQAGAALLSCVGTTTQILIIGGTIQPAWIVPLWLPALAGSLVAALWGGWMVWRHAAPPGSEVAGSKTPDTKLFRLRDAALIVLLLTAIQAGVHGLRLWLGDAGVMAGTLVAALADIHAVTAALLTIGMPGTQEATNIVWALGAAMLVHAFSKSAVAWASGGWRYALALAPGLFAHTFAFVGILMLVTLRG
ncbi:MULTISPECIES: MgtC/SapB family protein [Giesbergeria]|uniref:MgtC/SapB family protein n=1 Tax=Giesbergeria sinuosa TaxID=80883 RepID=A0ABV9QAU8_9BURK